MPIGLQPELVLDVDDNLALMRADSIVGVGLAADGSRDLAGGNVVGWLPSLVGLVSIEEERAIVVDAVTVADTL